MDMQGRRGAASQRSTTVNHGAQRPTRSAARQPQPAVIRPQVRIYGMQGVKAWIGLAVPGRPIDPWSRRTGAPQASATRRDRNPDAHAIAHGTRRDTPGRADTGWDDVAASAQLEGLAEARAGPLRTARGQFRSRCVVTACPMAEATATPLSAGSSGQPPRAARPTARPGRPRHGVEH
jgi:hypothetical protein